MSAIPSEVESAVARAVFDDMFQLGWDGLSNGQKSAQYGRWMKHLAIGGRLTKYVPEERARVWIKDGPVKEWRRAQAGMGRYAGMVQSAARPQEIVRAALGDQWDADEGTVKVKPLRVHAHSRSQDDDVILAWAPSKDLKHLVWAALQSEARGDPVRWHLVVTGSFTNPVPADRRAANRRIARRAGLPLSHVELE